MIWKACPVPLRAKSRQPCHGLDDFHSDSEVNRGGVQDPEYDAMVDAALGATSIEEQKRLIAEVDMYAIEQHWHIFGPKSPVYYIGPAVGQRL